MSVPLPSSRRQLVSQQAGAAFLGVHPRTIRNMISRGDLTGYQIPGVRAVRVDMIELQQLVRTIPTVSKRNRPKFGPKARIVQIRSAVVVPGTTQESEK